MANRRMFSKQIIDTDYFMEMPSSTQALYFHLALRADDDGFVASPRRILRLTGASDDDYKLLIAKQFLIPFDSGVCVIKHWRVHNYIQSDRYHKTIYTQELAQLDRDENGTYTECIQDVSEMDTQVRLELGKDRLGKGEDKEGKTLIDGYPVTESTHNQLVSTYTLPTVIDYYQRISDYVSSKGKKDYRDYAATARNWIKKDIAEGKFKRSNVPRVSEPDEIERAIMQRQEEKRGR